MWFTHQILNWYDSHGRKALPWKREGNNVPYYIWLSEIMLQQTQVATVIPYFERFIHRFPTIKTLADAPIDEVIAHWAGLGYYARARNLHKTAKIILDAFQGEIPRTLTELQALPGIGPSTAGAILSQGYNIRSPILDANVKRVLCRFYGVAGWPGTKVVQDSLWALSEMTTPDSRPNDYTQAIMDIGALVCKASKPLCTHCPLSAQCVALATHTIERYPERKPAKIKPAKQTQFVMLFNPQNQILLIKRPPSGIWGGLWCLPELSNLGSDLIPISRKSVRRHTFTHYHLDYETILARTPCSDKNTINNYLNDCSWCTLADIKKLGLPAPHKILITELTREIHDAYSKLSQTT